MHYKLGTANMAML